MSYWREKRLKKIAKIQLPVNLKGNPKGKTKPFEFEVCIPLEPKTLKSSLLQYFSSQHILANEKLSENIAIAEAGKDWKRLLLPIAAIMGGVTITCIIAMLLASGKLGGAAGAQIISVLWH